MFVELISLQKIVSVYDVAATYRRTTLHINIRQGEMTKDGLHAYQR
jgi:hypothetical protein